MTKNRQTIASGFGLALLAIGFLSEGQAHAIPLSRGAWPIYTAVVEKTTPPAGWSEFCATYKTECDVNSSLPRKIALTAEVWDKLVEVNHWANGHIKPTPDRKHWGRINKWYFAEDGRGDCKDYVLVKRRMLMQAGLPREALLITVVWTPRGNGHAVLIVRTNKGDYVLDNLSSRVVLWNQTPYDYVMRQTQSNPNSWVYIDGNPLEPPKVEDAENPIYEPAVLVSGLNNGVPKIEVVAGVASDGSKPKSQTIASRSIDDSTPVRPIVVDQANAATTSKPQIFENRAIEGSGRDAVASYVDVAANQRTIGPDASQSSTINFDIRDIVRQVLASGVGW